MLGAPIPTNDEERLAALARYNILDTEIEEIFDRITLMAKSMFRTPIALISLVDSDRQWFKSHAGLDARETPRDQAFCGYAILQPEPLVVEDATKDPRFADNPLVVSDPHIRFYAGAQLVTHDGHMLGTLCIIDRTPRQFLDVDVKLLQDLARLAMNEIELKLLKSTDQRAAEYSNRDEATNEYNQQTFKRIFDTECQRANRHSGELSLALAQFENADDIRREWGGKAIELLAKSVATAIKSVVRSSDVLARVSTDEFALIMPNTKSQAAEVVARRFLKRVVNSDFKFSDQKLPCVVNVGIATKTSGQKATDFYKEAEKNCRTAKENAQNICVSDFAV